jgi:hypothetical protein
MGKSREKIINFFGKDDKTLKDDVEYKLKSIQKNLDSKSKNKLKEYGIKDLTQVVAVGGKNFAEIAKEKSHGIGRALDNVAGTSLIAYILIFLLAKGSMWGSGILKKDIIKKRAKQVSKIAIIPQTLWKVVTWPVRAIKKSRWREKLGEMGKNPEYGGWNDDQLALWKGLPRKEKNKAVDSLFDKIKHNKKELRKEKKVIKKKLKGRKNKKERKIEINKLEDAAETKAKKLGTSGFKELFKKVKAKDGKNFLEALVKI